MTELEKNYNIKERAEKLIEQYTSAELAIKFLQTQLEEWEEFWSKYSSDCLGHGIICTELLITYLERNKNEK